MEGRMQESVQKKNVEFIAVGGFHELDELLRHKAAISDGSVKMFDLKVFKQFITEGLNHVGLEPRSSLDGMIVSNLWIENYSPSKSRGDWAIWAWGKVPPQLTDDRDKPLGGKGEFLGVFSLPMLPK
jgi:hypothetical protein